jgi:hypothetical protein
MFDDIGCMVLWFHDEQIAWADKAKIWITDTQTGKWINARMAYYDTENITPMAYGFAAHDGNGTTKEHSKMINFKEVSKRIFKIEANKNRKTY